MRQLILELIEAEGMLIGYTRLGADGIFTPFEKQDEIANRIKTLRDRLKSEYNWEAPKTGPYL